MVAQARSHHTTSRLVTAHMKTKNVKTRFCDQAGMFLADGITFNHAKGGDIATLLKTNCAMNNSCFDLTKLHVPDYAARAGDHARATCQRLKRGRRCIPGMRMRIGRPRAL